MTCFFLQFPTRRERGILPGVTDTTHDFQGGRIHAMTELLDRQQLSVGKQGDDIHPVGTKQTSEFVFPPGMRRAAQRPHLTEQTRVPLDGFIYIFPGLAGVEIRGMFSKQSHEHHPTCTIRFIWSAVGANVRAMFQRTILVPVLLSLLALGCNSEDPRLPQSLYDDAVKLNTDGKTLEAKSLMELIAKRYPDTPAGTQARKDLYLLDTLLKQDIQERQKQVRIAMRNTSTALIRFHSKNGEYPNTLETLVPDFIDKVPEAPWGHPFLYRPYVKTPIQDIPGRRGEVTQRINTKYDGFFLVCLGVDLQPGGDASGMTGDTYIVDGEFYKEKTLPMVPLPQPVK